MIRVKNVTTEDDRTQVIAGWVLTAFALLGLVLFVYGFFAERYGVIDEKIRQLVQDGGLTALMTGLCVNYWAQLRLRRPWLAAFFVSTATVFIVLYSVKLTLDMLY